MIALYVLGVAAVYLGIGSQCANLDIRDSVRNDCGLKETTHNALIAMWGWPFWVIIELPRQLLELRVEKSMAKAQLKLESDREVEKLLESGEIDL